MRKTNKFIPIFLIAMLVFSFIMPMASAEEAKTYTQQYLGDGFHRITPVPQTDAGTGEVTNTTFEIEALKTETFQVEIKEDGTYGIFISQNKVNGAYPDNNFGLSFTKGTGEDEETVTVAPTPTSETSALATTTRYAYVRIGADSASNTDMIAELSKGTWTMSFTPLKAVSLNYIDLRSVVIPVDGSKQAIYPIDVYEYGSSVGRYLNEGASNSLDRFLGYKYYGDLYNEELSARTFGAKGITVISNKTATYKLDVKEAGIYAINLYLRHYVRATSVTTNSDVTITPTVTATGNDPITYPHTFAQGSGSVKSYMQYHTYIVNLAEGENTLTVKMPNLKDTSLDLYFIALEKIGSYLGDGYTKTALQNEAFAAGAEKTFDVEIPEDGDYAVYVKKSETAKTNFTASFTNGAQTVSVSDGGAASDAYAYNYVRLGAISGNSGSASLTKGKWTLKLSSNTDITVSDIDIRKTIANVSDEKIAIYPSDYNTLALANNADVNGNLSKTAFARVEDAKYWADYTTRYGRGINLGASKAVTYKLYAKEAGKYKISAAGTATGNVTLSAGNVTNEAFAESGCESIVTLSEGVNTLTITAGEGSSLTLNSITVAPYDEEKVNTHSIIGERIREFVNAGRRFYNDEAYFDYSLTLTDIYETSQNDNVAGLYIPQTLTLDWEDADGATSYTLYVSTTKDFSGKVVTVEDITASTYNITDKINLYADTVYYWYAEADNGQKTAVEAFYTEDTVRTVYIDGVDNSRDIGGWNGLHQGRAYRSAKLSGIDDTGEVDTSTSITEAGIDTVVNDLGVKTQLDLRGYSYTEGPLGDDVNFVATQIGSYMSAYSNVTEYAKTIRVFADSDNYPIIFHCAGGCDRTGTVTFIIQALSGVSEGDLSVEFELTNFSRYYRNRDRSGTIDAFPFDELIKKLKTYEGTTLQEKAENYALTTLELTRSEISNIQSMMAGNGVTFAETKNIVLGKASPITLKDLGDHEITGITFNGEKRNYSLSGNVLTVSCEEEGTYEIVFADGNTLKFDVEEKAISVESVDETNFPNLKSLSASNTPELEGATSTGNFLPQKGQFITENDKYIVVSICSNSFFNNLATAVQVFDKETGTLLKTFAKASNNALYFCPAKTVSLDGDTLYITWSNSLRSLSTIYLSAEKCPTVAYDLSKLALEKDEQAGEVTVTGTVAEKTIDSGNYASSTKAPTLNAANSYLNSEEGLIYTSKVTGAKSTTRNYTAYKTDDVEAALAEGTTPSAAKLFHTTGLSTNSVQFVYKDGFLYEVLQQNCGISGLDKETYLTLKNSEGAALNNMVYVYDLRKADISSDESTDITESYLCGIYTTSLTDDAAILDIEVDDKNMYLSTKGGIEVVSLIPVRESESIPDTPITLTKSATLCEEGFSAESTDLEIFDNDYLFVAYRAVTVEEVTSPSAVAVYDISEEPELKALIEPKTSARKLSVDEANSVVYILADAAAPPKMYAYSFEVITRAEIAINSVKVGDGETIQSGKHDIKVDISNDDLAEGRLVCALYEGKQLSKLFVSDNIFPDGELTIAQDYEISDAITRIKVMLLKDLDSTLIPLAGSKEITK